MVAGEDEFFPRRIQVQYVGGYVAAYESASILSI